MEDNIENNMKDKTSLTLKEIDRKLENITKNLIVLGEKLETLDTFGDEILDDINTALIESDSRLKKIRAARDTNPS